MYVLKNILHFSVFGVLYRTDNQPPQGGGAMGGPERVVARIQQLCEALSNDVGKTSMEYAVLRVWAVFDPRFTFAGVNCKEVIRDYFHPDQESLPGLS